MKRSSFIQSFITGLLLIVFLTGVIGCGGGGSPSGGGGSAPAAPGAPNLTPADSQLTASWAAVAGATGYEVYYHTADDSSGATKFPDSDEADTTCIITGLTNDTTYYVWVKAKNNHGISGFSPSASGTPAAAPSAPEAPGKPSLTADDAQLIVNWDPVAGATAYEVWYHTILHCYSATQFADPDETDTTCVITGLNNGTTYYVWIKAKNQHGTSDFGSWASATPLAPPPAPDAPTLTPADSQLTASWTAVAETTAYEVYYNTEDATGTAAKFLGDGDDTDTTCVITGLTNGTLYYVWVKSKNDHGVSGFSPSASGTPAIIAPEAPGAPSLTPANGSLIANWSAVAGATQYEVYYSTIDDSGTAIQFLDDGDDTDTSCEITGLSNGIIYYVWLKAKNAGGTSGFSPSASGTPQPVKRYFVYVTSNSSTYISGFAVDPNSGALTPIAGSPFSVGEITWRQAATPDGKFLYVTTNGKQKIYGFSINPVTGVLSPINMSFHGSYLYSSGSWPLPIMINPAGTYAYVGNSTSDNISVYAINPTTGALSEIAGSPFASDGESPNSMAITPDGQYIYTANRDTNNISAYTIGGDGSLSQITGSPFAAGSITCGIAVTPSGGAIYAVNNSDNNISGYTIEAGGALSEVASSPFDSAGQPRTIAIHPNGRFAFVNRYYPASIVTFTIGGNDVLSEAYTASGVNSVYCVTVDPLGKFVYAVNYPDHTVSAYTVDSVTGELTPIAGSPYATGANPYSVIVVETTN